MESKFAYLRMGNMADTSIRKRRKLTMNFHSFMLSANLGWLSFTVSRCTLLFHTL